MNFKYIILMITSLPLMTVPEIQASQSDPLGPLKHFSYADFDAVTTCDRILYVAGATCLVSMKNLDGREFGGVRKIELVNHAGSMGILVYLTWTGWLESRPTWRDQWVEHRFMQHTVTSVLHKHDLKRLVNLVPQLDELLKKEIFQT